MDPFTTAYLSNLTANLAALVIPKVARRFQATWSGSDSNQAIERCLHLAIIGMVSKASTDVPEQQHLLADIFSDFFQNEELAIHLMRLVRLQPLEMDEMSHLFAEAGYDAQTLPGLRLVEAVAAFEAAFFEAATLEPTLQPIMQVHQGWAQTELQREMVVLMRQMLDALRQSGGQKVGIQAHSIVAGNVVNGTQIIYQWPGQPSVGVLADDSARRVYLNWLLRDRQNLPLRGIDLSASDAGGTRRPPELTQIYVTLNTTTQITEERGGKQDPTILDREETRKPMTALMAASTHAQMVLLGDPGGGKSTFINHLAYCLAAHQLYPEAGWLTHLPGWSVASTSLLPVTITLRDFARWLPVPLPGKAKPQHLWDFLVDWLTAEKLEAALPVLEQALAQGEVVWLLDGLDEVTNPAQRRFVRDVVLSLTKRYAGNRFLVTCRVWSYQPPDSDKDEEDLRLLPTTDYPDYELAGFDPAQRDQFIQAWYQELQRQGHLPGRDATRLSRDLQQAIHRSDLQRLAGNPLLLTVMAMVHVHEGRLPDYRALLYERTIDLLLWRWEETKADQDLPTLRQLLQQANRADIDLKRRLGELAYTVHLQAGTGSDEERMADIAEASLCAELSKLNKKDLGWGQALLQVIKSRAGLLVERTPGQFTFPHRTFQEYLAGTHLALLSDMPEQAMALAQQDVGWWPLVLFAVEYLVYVGGDFYKPLKLISHLCPPKEPATVAEWLLVRLAGETLLSLGQERFEEVEWGVQLAGRVRQRLTQIVTQGLLTVRERAEAGKTLALLGDTRPGVGTVMHEGVKIPDVAWGGLVPAGTYTIGDDGSQYEDEKSRVITIHQSYRLARYPVTHGQFQCFVEAGDFDDPRWWAGMPAEEEAYGQQYQLTELSEPSFPFANHPRETVSWYQAMAFCRWLSDKVGYGIDLPHEYEWEVAARYPHNGFYPWGNDFDPQKTNTSEGDLNSTTAVGIYPQGANSALDLLDLSGNVWEWCRNKYEKPDDAGVDASGERRVLRGGSWDRNRLNARAAARRLNHPNNRNADVGFRVVCRPPSQDH